MDAVKLAGLKPEAVFGYFEKICSIPHGSQNTKMISDYLVQFAREHDITYIQDEDNNVIFFQEGTCGMEDHPAVILQGHMDMVTEKDADCPIDMATEGLDVTHDGKFVFAKGKRRAVGNDDLTVWKVRAEIVFHHRERFCGRHDFGVRVRVRERENICRMVGFHVLDD